MNTVCSTISVFSQALIISPSRVSGVFGDKWGPGGREVSGEVWDCRGPKETRDMKEDLYVILEQTIVLLVYFTLDPCALCRVTCCVSHT